MSGRYSRARNDLGLLIREGVENVPPPIYVVIAGCRRSAKGQKGKVCVVEMTQWIQSKTCLGVRVPVDTLRANIGRQGIRPSEPSCRLCGVAP